jgi:dihydropteroate synthase
MKYIELRDNKKFFFNKMKIMGIINCTPDSFYSDSRLLSQKLAVKKALEMIEAGADIIDIGGESTRPGSEPVTLEEELERVIPVIEEIRKVRRDVLISIDTYRAKTAEEAIKAGADIINDISAMAFDEDMASVAVNYNVPVILMHMKGTPRNMQENPQYTNILDEVMSFFEERLEFAKQKGISQDKIIIDPGIGFGKSFEHNIELIRNIDKFHKLNRPVLLAVSRKSSIGIATGNVPPQERLEGTIAVTCYAALKDVEIIRVHDVLENKKALMMIEVLK